MTIEYVNTENVKIKEDPLVILSMIYYHALYHLSIIGAQTRTIVSYIMYGNKYSICNVDK